MQEGPASACNCHVAESLYLTLHEGEPNCYTGRTRVMIIMSVLRCSALQATHARIDRSGTVHEHMPLAQAGTSLWNNVHIKPAQVERKRDEASEE